MRTTLDIADDVLLAAKELARRQKTTAGKVLSELARKGLKAASEPASPAAHPERSGEELFGFKPFPSRGGIVTNEIIDRLREQDGV